MRTAFILLFVFLSLSAFCQKDTAVKATVPGVYGGVYVPEHTLPRRLRYEYQDLDIHYNFPGLKDPARFEKLVEKAKQIQKRYSAKPLELKDAVYFSQVSSMFLDTLEEYSFFLNVNMFKPKVSDRLHDPTRIIYPSSLRFHCDSVWLARKEDSLSPWQINATVNMPMENYLQPFYFSTHEVTNKEYREFVHWVTDSLMRELLASGDSTYYKGKRPDGSPRLDWSKKIDLSTEQAKELANELYLPAHERFYNTREVDHRKINYVFMCKGPKGPFKNIINVYPDTLCWLHDFNYSYNEPMTNNYFWHPAYDDYPVVGIGYVQAIAFLYWKTMMMQKELDAKGSSLKIEYDLPSDIEWDIASTAEKRYGLIEVFTGNYRYLRDDSWFTDLEIKNFSQGDTVTNQTYTTGVLDGLGVPPSRFIRRGNVLPENLKHHFGMEWGYRADGHFHTCEADLTKKDWNKKDKAPKEYLLANYLDATSISFLGGNVSEWTKETYADWKKVFNIRQQLLAKIAGADVKLLKELELYYDSYNDTGGHLIRGANWFDERCSANAGKNTAGNNAKRFCDEHGGSWSGENSTVGFRYVIHVTYKDK